MADPQIGVFVNQNFFTQGQGNPQILVSATNGAAPVVGDVHVGVVAPDGTIYEYPNWNTNLQPWLPSYTIPANLNLPATLIVELPAGIPPGIWTAYAAITEPGTLNFISLDLAPFNLIPAGSTGTAYGALTLSYHQTPSGVDVDTSGVFAQTDSELVNLIQGFEGQQPPLETCVFNQTALNLTSIPNITVLSLDAGESILLSNASTAASVSLIKDQDALSFGYIFYQAPEGQPGNAFYQGEATYTFNVPGGPNLSAANVSLTAPLPLMLTQPVLTMSAMHNAATDMVLAWNGNSGIGEVEASLSGVDFSNVYSIDCRFSDDGSASIPAALITQLRDALASGTGSIPGLPPGIELPPGLNLGATASLDVSRVNYTMFNTVSQELAFGIATIDSGASMSLTLQ
jgi:hypothetical protein